VLRETAETALFLQGLAGDSREATAWGAAAGLLALALFVAFVSRAGFRLPMKALFNASTVLLVGTAVVLVGKGMHGLQELGVLGLAPIPFFELQALGLFADAWPTGAQVALLAAVLAFGWYHRPRAVPAVAPEG
jgi:high-affinity iron transporter